MYQKKTPVTFYNMRISTHSQGSITIRKRHSDALTYQTKNRSNLCARNTPSPTRSDFIMHISCMTQRPCKPFWRGVSTVFRGRGLMQNHAPYACTRSLKQASQKKGCFRDWGTVKPRSTISIAAGTVQSMKCLVSAITAVTI